jgi:hypothetical protein
MTAERLAPLALAALAAAGLAPSAYGNDFPTQARVEFVLRCMDSNGGQNYDTLYACVCTIDRIAEAFSYDEFSEAEAFALMRSTPGERGGVFRDPDRARALQKKYQETVAGAEHTCRVGPERNASEEKGG